MCNESSITEIVRYLTIWSDNTITQECPRESTRYITYFIASALNPRLQALYGVS